MNTTKPDNVGKPTEVKCIVAKKTKTLIRIVRAGSCPCGCAVRVSKGDSGGYTVMGRRVRWVVIGN